MTTPRGLIVVVCVLVAACVAVFTPGLALIMAVVASVVFANSATCLAAERAGGGAHLLAVGIQNSANHVRLWLFDRAADAARPAVVAWRGGGARSAFAVFFTTLLALLPFALATLVADWLALGATLAEMMGHGDSFHIPFAASVELAQAMALLGALTLLIELYREASGHATVYFFVEPPDEVEATRKRKVFGAARWRIRTVLAQRWPALAPSEPAPLPERPDHVLMRRLAASGIMLVAIFFAVSGVVRAAASPAAVRLRPEAILLGSIASALALLISTVVTLAVIAHALRMPFAFAILILTGIAGMVETLGFIACITTTICGDFMLALLPSLNLAGGRETHRYRSPPEMAIAMASLLASARGAVKAASPVADLTADRATTAWTAINGRRVLREMVRSAPGIEELVNHQANNGRSAHVGQQGPNDHRSPKHNPQEQKASAPYDRRSNAIKIGARLTQAAAHLWHGSGASANRLAAAYWRVVSLRPEQLWLEPAAWACPNWLSNMRAYSREADKSEP